MAMKDIRLTTFGPYYSLTISVITNSRGQSNTPQVRLMVNPSAPNSENGCGVPPNSVSSENILVPIDSAISALQQKKAVMPSNNLVGLCWRIVLSINTD